MSTNEEHIEQLMSEKLAGIIVAEDEVYLDQLIASSEQIRQSWEHYQARFPETHIANNFRKGDDIQWAPLTQRKPSHVIWLKRIAVAAVLTGACASAFYLLHNDPQPEPGGIRLKLSSGQVVDLSSTKQHIQLPGTALKNDQKSLTYASDNTPPEGMNELTVPIGKDYKVTLDDGTVVWMNSATRLHFPFKFNGAEREIAIEGEAYLEVAQNAGKPFKIRAGKSTIQVLGTAFNVNSYEEDKVIVSLVNGAVKVNSLLLKPGRQAIVQEGREVTEQSFLEERELSWRKGIFHFEEAYLKDICRVLPRWFGIRVELDNTAIALEKFTGRLDRNMPLKDFLEKLKQTTTVDYYFDGDNVLHLR